jgi:N-acetylglucosamine-6-phosphate deacetylase
VTDSEANAIMLRNVRAVLPERIIEIGTLLIEGGLISEILDSSFRTPAKADSVLDLEGLTVFPGFIDVHIHGAVGIDLMEADANGLRRGSQFLATQGTCAWLPTLVPAPQENYHAAVSAIDELMGSQCDAPRSARALGVHYEGPFVSELQCGALHKEFFRTFRGPASLNDLPVPSSSEARKMMTVAPEVEGGVALVRELKHRGWVVSLGHTRAGVESLEQAHAAGASHMTHFMNAMAPLHHRSPGPVAWGLGRDDVSCDFIADGIHLDPFILKMLVKLKGSDRLLLISDAIAATGMGDGDFQIWDETISVKDGRTSNARGTIAGSVITMLDGVRMMLSLGLAEVDVARMAATNPAELLGVSNECGSIEVGKRADLVALDKEGNVSLTLVGGEVTYRR